MPTHSSNRSNHYFRNEWFKINGEIKGLFTSLTLILALADDSRKAQLLKERAKFCPCSLPTTRSFSRSHLLPTSIIGTYNHTIFSQPYIIKIQYQFHLIEFHSIFLRVQNRHKEFQLYQWLKMSKTNVRDKEWVCAGLHRQSPWPWESVRGYPGDRWRWTERWCCRPERSLGHSSCTNHAWPWIAPTTICQNMTMHNDIIWHNCVMVCSRNAGLPCQPCQGSPACTAALQLPLATINKAP